MRFGYFQLCWNFIQKWPKSTKKSLVNPMISLFLSLEIFIQFSEQLKKRGTDGVVRGGRVHFNLHRDQFSSDCQTIWDGSLLGCNKAVNFFVWPSDGWKLKFWTFLKKVWQILSSWGLKIGQIFFWKNRKNDEKFFFELLFVLCSTDCIMFPRLHVILQKPFLVL